MTQPSDAPKTSGGSRSAIADREPPEVFGASDGWVMSTLSSGERLSPWL